MAALRFHVQPGDVPLAAAARRLGLEENQFRALLPRLLSRGFPAPDVDTGHFDIEAIDDWRRRRHHATAPLTGAPSAMEARDTISRRLKGAFGGHG